MYIYVIYVYTIHVYIIHNSIYTQYICYLKRKSPFLLGYIKCGILDAGYADRNCASPVNSLSSE